MYHGDSVGITRGTLRRFLRLRTDKEFPHFDAKNKLELLAVKAGMKPAFLGIVEGSETPLRVASALLDLRCKLSTTPPPYFSRTPHVTSSFLTAYGRACQTTAFWIYSEERIETDISATLAGKLNEGHVLGYPQCCVKWHEEKRTLQAEASFQDIELYISENPSDLMNRGYERIEEEYEALLCTCRPPTYSENEERVFGEINDHIERTYKTYPFAPHWACSPCLDGKNMETEKLNLLYKKLAMDVSPKLAQTVVESLEDALRTK
jgi:hypothetical protein